MKDTIKKIDNELTNINKLFICNHRIESIANSSERKYQYKEKPRTHEVNVPQTNGGLGKGPASYIDVDGEEISVRLHKWTRTVASDQDGNIYAFQSIYRKGMYIGGWKLI